MIFFLQTNMGLIKFFKMYQNLVTMSLFLPSHVLPCKDTLLMSVMECKILLV
jgi:hypothetical protein